MTRLEIPLLSARARSAKNERWNKTAPDQGSPPPLYTLIPRLFQYIFLKDPDSSMNKI